MRIALAAEGTRGDLHPLLALGQVCREAGHEVVVCAASNFEPEAREMGFEFYGTGDDVVDFLTQHAGALIDGGLPMIRAQSEYLDELLDHHFSVLPQATRGADLVVGAGVQLAGASAAQACGAAYRYVAYCPALLPSRTYGPAMFTMQNLPQWANALLWRYAMPGIFRLLRGRINARRAALGLWRIRDPPHSMLGERPILAADRELAPIPGDCPFPVQQVGAFHLEAEGPLPEKLEDFLNSGPAPVYIGFGSMTDPDAAATTGRLLEAISRAGCRALVSRGWARLAEGPLPGDVFPLDPVSHARLFPRVAAVVHHGGAGTTTSAARAGVPQIIVPHVMDQFYWCRRVTELGLGPPALPRKRLDPMSLGDSIALTIENEVLAERARQVGERLRAGDPLRPENREALLREVLHGLPRLG